LPEKRIYPPDDSGFYCSEVVGDAGEYFDPNDILGIGDAI
jgi:hypothetical protein